MAKKIIVIGATGLVGGYVVDELVKRGCSVEVWVRSAKKEWLVNGDDLYPD